VSRGASSGAAPVGLRAAARSLAERHLLSDRKPRPLASLARLEAFPHWLSAARARLSKVPANAEVAPAAEWLLDNAYLLEEAVRQIREDLPPGYYAELPALAAPGSSRPPRVAVLAQGLLRATRLQLSATGIRRFVSAYQEVETLQLGELWALPTMLRLACIETLVAAFERLVPDLPTLSLPDSVEDLPLELDDSERVARAIRGLSVLAQVSWPLLVQRTSAIEALLRSDPSGFYPAMDAETRDRYRRAVEDLARRSHHGESEVARRVLARARRGVRGSREAHVGFWLVAEGRAAVEDALRYRPALLERGRRALRRHATGTYLGALVALTLLFCLGPAAYLEHAGARAGVWAAGLLLVLLPASMLAVTVLHWGIAWILPPTVLPKLGFEAGIPARYKTAVVIPGLLGSAADVQILLHQIERHYLSNPDASLRFALLTGYREAKTEHRPEDAPLLEQVVCGLRELNRRHGSGGAGPFLLLHRERSFNALEQRWMGWERKRGKLQELNRLLLREGDSSFRVHVGDRAALEGVRFVITLDADTVLPRGAAARLVGTLAHPLNRPEFDEASGRVRAGYTIVQPRIETSPDSGSRSLFTRLYCGDTAIDIYSRAVSDVYQDLFGTGIYVGKAIYDVAAFSRSLAGRVPENALASHDLFEGIHGRAALATDIVLYEDYPPSYLDFSRRLHRWVRGDWQLLPWLRGRVPGAHWDYLPNRFAAIDRWKVLDNLRRSVLPPALLLLLLSGWTWLPGHPLVWTGFAILAPTGHLFVDFASGLVRKRWGLSRDLPQSLREDAGRWLLLLAFLPHQVAIICDAIARTVVRVTFTKRHLLQWTSSAHATAALAGRQPVLLAWSEMFVAPLAAAAVTVALLRWRVEALPVALPLLALWAVSPEIARRISRPSEARREELAPEQRRFLRGLARRTWLFFESFVGPDGHWLPPDNYQEDPGRIVAHRTSPTNIGMLLLSSLAAYDLGYLGSLGLVLRLRNTLHTVGRLEHYRGHLLNWYHTRTLQPLAPRYISTVDSGNFAAALLAVAQGCRELPAAAHLRVERWEGLHDSIALLGESLPALLAESDRPHLAELEARSAAMASLALEAVREPEAWTASLAGIESGCAQLEATLRESVAGRRLSVDVDALREARLWLARVREQVRAMRHQADSLAPWLAPLCSAPKLAANHPAAAIVAETRDRLFQMLRPEVALESLGKRCEEARSQLALVRRSLVSEDTGRKSTPQVHHWLDEIEQALVAGAGRAKELQSDLAALAADAEREALAMDFSLLYDRSVGHFYIGYNQSADQMDPHHYDLLASEARLTSLAAIAKGDVPVDHWFALDRPLTRVEGAAALLSWGGTSFEYLMPPLLVRSHAGTLLGESQRAAVKAQMAEGRRLGLPWGVSESGFSALDADHNYQYRAFGIQRLGRRRGLGEDRVVAPYASALALPLFPVAAVENLERLEKLGMLGRYGLYEAVDFTADRLPEGSQQAIVASYMSHHQGMLLAAMDNLLVEDALVQRFEADPRVQATKLLLQERVPAHFDVEVPSSVAPLPAPAPAERPPALLPWRPDPGVRPSVHLLGNGQLGLCVSDAGAGGLRWREHALTRHLADGTLDDSGVWIYVRDDESGDVWSVGRQPSGSVGAQIDVVFHAHLVELHRRQHGVSVRTDIAVGAADDVEIRRLTVVNESGRPRSLAFTSYGEVVLAPPREDAQHLAFSKLFVEASYLPRQDALVFQRRPRSPEEHPPVLLHRLIADSPDVVFKGFEADRERFIGRGRTTRRPQGLEQPLSGSEGATLDPILAIQAGVQLAPFATARLAFVTVAGPSRQVVEAVAARYDTLASLEWLLADAHAEAEKEMGSLGLAAERLPELQTLLSALLASGTRLRASAGKRAGNRLTQQDLWGLGISGDDPILLLRSRDPTGGALLPDLVRAHQLWRRRGCAVDLVVLAQAPSGYRDDALADLRARLAGLGAEAWLGRHGGIHLVRADQVSEAQATLLEVAASAVLSAEAGSIREQLAPREIVARPLPPLAPTREAGRPRPAEALARTGDLVFDNDLGGFSRDGREYVIHLAPGQTTPAPWCNVLANAEFGSLVSETGGGYTWAGNCGEFRLTPWSNDPVLDPPSEAIYLRDEETTEVWSPTPGPAGSAAVCQVRHGAGYTEWRQNSRGLEQKLRAFVPVDDPVKLMELTLRNREKRTRRITVTCYVRWLLGRTAEEGASRIVLDYDAGTRSLRAVNRWNPDFCERTAFLTSDRDPHGLSTDRVEFLGREGELGSPAGLRRIGLSGRIGGENPCAALQVHLDIGPGEEVRTHFVLGAGRDREHASLLAATWREPAAVERAWTALADRWDALLGAVTVHTPEPAMDLLLNRWALYQALAARILARTGFYQSSGAFGFRDQLQDVLALLHTDPEATRKHILECARHQFEEGDVLHWWHPPADRGVRTRCSDDLLWLPYATACYVEATGDLAVLDEEEPFLVAPPLAADEHERYERFHHGDARASLFEHCRRALERGITRGPHGLPLMGAGDWNDGMDRVGKEGRGESVWLGWFAGATAQAFAALCDRRGEAAAAEGWRSCAQQLFAAVENEGWDGAWYRRAFDDAGAAWGSSKSDECRIDSIAQSWSVLSGGAAPERALQALRSAERELVRQDAQVARLLWPPFDLTPRDPGYIKAYPPGIRENGGQYSHAAAWLGFALAQRGDGAGAVRVFRMLNPIERTRSPEAVRRYRLEPYALAADIASVEPHLGRGGWSWYTGSAAWCWRLGVEGILGLQRTAEGLRIAPQIPPQWPGFEAEVRMGGGVLEIRVERSGEGAAGAARILVDGEPLAGDVVPLPGSGAKRRVRVCL